MTDAEYFAQRLNPREFERLWFFRCNPDSPENYYRMGEKGPLFSINYHDELGCMSLYQHSDWSWDDRTPLLERVFVFTPNELKFLLDRSGRFGGISSDFKRPPCGGSVTIECGGGAMAYLPACGSDHGFEKKKRRTGVGSASWSTIINQAEPWGKELSLGAFETMWCQASGEYATASVSGSMSIQNVPVATYYDLNPIFSDMSTEIAAGDLVVLKSGGPTMTVGKTFNSGGSDQVECTWFHVTDYLHPTDLVEVPGRWGDPRTYVFPASALKKV